MVARHSHTVAPLPPPVPGLRLPMTYEEWLSWAPENLISEWANGEGYVAMSATDLHQRLLGFLYQLLSAFVAVRRLGEVRLAPLEVKLWPEGPAREPDLLFASAARRGQLTALRFEGGPDLVVELVSDDSVKRDRETKRGEYAQAGVEEYWLLDPRPGPRRQPSLTVYRLDTAGIYQEATPLRAGVARSDVLPGFWLQVEWLWQDPLPEPLALLAEILHQPEGPGGREDLEALAALPYTPVLLNRERAMGLAEGEARGRAEGEARGRAEGLRMAVRRLVVSRFGDVPPALEAALAATADEATLNALLDQAMTARSVADLLTSY